MTGLIPMIAGNNSPAVAVGSLVQVLAIFQNARNNPNNNNNPTNHNIPTSSIASNRKRKKKEKDELLSLSQRRKPPRKTFRMLSSPGRMSPTSPSPSSPLTTRTTKITTTATKTESNNNNNNNNEYSQVRNRSNNPAIELYRMWFHVVPQIFRFFVAGNLGNLGFFGMEKIIYKLLSYLLISLPSSISGCTVDMATTIKDTATAADATSIFTTLCSSMIVEIEKYQDGISFFSAYLLQIVTTHLLYAFLVYGIDTIDTYEKYTKTLYGQFKVYGVGLFGATALNSFLLKQGFDKTASFWITTATFAGFNYFLISWIVKNAIESSSSSSVAPTTTTTNALTRKSRGFDANEAKFHMRQKGIRQQNLIVQRMKR
mmetsp:Transcript_15950/g.17227  ORF Transcript_15950/g.17227 Transcript_15950/m.17227 type:complete len:372 (+) Transcript_15950:85-1200(+)